MTRKFDLGELAKQLGAAILLTLVVIAVYAYSYFTGGSLTTAKSCSSSYISGEYDIRQLRRQCPNLKKENLIEAVEEYYQKNGTEASTTKKTLLQDINDNY
ncbi:MAG: hypothetical protein NUV84_05295 [Candidatus Uhrbacteria bacterium]|nr:hypothetical protein [Candidatus Uhrbacteria bacterium]